MKIYHQQEKQLCYSKQGNNFIFGENNNYHPKGNAYLEFDKTAR